MCSAVRGRLPTRPRAVGTAALSVLLGVCALFVLHVTGAPAARADSVLDAAADGLRGSPLYVAPATGDRLGPLAQEEIRARLRTAQTPIYVAVLPRSAAQETWGDATRLPAAIYERLLDRGTYAVLVGDRLVASSTTIGESASRIAEAADGMSSDDPAVTLLDFIDGVERSASLPLSSAQRERPTTSRGFPWGLLFTLGVLGAGYLLVRRTRDRVGAEMGEVIGVANDDLSALGDDLAEADPDTSGLGATNPGRWDPVSGAWSSESTRQASVFHRRGLDAFDRAKLALVTSRDPADIGEVSRAVAEGRFTLACARAAAAGEPLPPRRAPCFFDPSHGPSSVDAQWAPPSGRARLVPVCPTCADRIARGDTPGARQVPVGRRRVPYWAAGPAYAAWAEGYFCDYQDHRLSSLLHGTELGAALTATTSDDGRP